jgi:hypothetical protein
MSRMGLCTTGPVEVNMATACQRQREGVRLRRLATAMWVKVDCRRFRSAIAHVGRELRGLLVGQAGMSRQVSVMV